MPQIKLFVYGTLLTTAEHPMGVLLRQYGTSLGQGTIRARLYWVNDPDDPGANFYPAAVPSGHPEDRVYGELYAVDAPGSVLSQFDEYEACSPNWPEPHEFLRRPISVRLTDGTDVKAISYLYTWDVSRAELIASGRFTEKAPETR